MSRSAGHSASAWMPWKSGLTMSSYFFGGFSAYWIDAVGTAPEPFRDAPAARDGPANTGPRNRAPTPCRACGTLPRAAGNRRACPGRDEPRHDRPARIRLHRGCRDRPVPPSRRCCGPCGWSGRSGGSASDIRHRSRAWRSPGIRAMQSSNVPCWAGTEPWLRGTISYQAPARASGRSIVSGNGADWVTSRRGSHSAMAAATSPDSSIRHRRCARTSSRCPAKTCSVSRLVGIAATPGRRLQAPRARRQCRRCA